MEMLEACCPTPASYCSSPRKTRNFELLKDSELHMYLTSSIILLSQDPEQNEVLAGLTMMEQNYADNIEL